MRQMSARFTPTSSSWINLVERLFARKAEGLAGEGQAGASDLRLFINVARPTVSLTS